MKSAVRFLMIVLVLSLTFNHCPNIIGRKVIEPSSSSSLSQKSYMNVESNVTFTWTSRWQEVPQEIVNGSSIAGDHIVIQSTWDVPVTSSNITISCGFNETREGFVAEPIEDYEWPSLLCCMQNFSWETFEGVHAGDELQISLNLSKRGDSAFDIYHWTDRDFDNEVDLDELGPLLLAVDSHGSGVPESATFRSRFSEPIAIRTYCWTYAYTENMTYALRVDTMEEIVIDNEPDDPSVVLFDSYYLFRNATANITLRASNSTNHHSIKFFQVTLGNFFVPEVGMLVPPPVCLYNDNPQFGTSQEIPPTPILEGIKNVAWWCEDPNANDTNYFTLWISSDYGTTFQLLAENLTETIYLWDSTGFLDMDYIFRVRAYSLDFTVHENGTLLCSAENPPESYWPGDYADTITLAWEDNHIIPVTVTDTTTTDTTTMPNLFTPVLIVSIGISAGLISGIVILEVFRRKRITIID